MWDGSAFTGTKIALICGGEVVAYLRDDKDTIPFPGHWDLPGGGREGDESPITCVLREVEEEFGLRIAPERVSALTRYTSQRPDGLDSYFCVAEIAVEDIEQIVFGDEGQMWQMMAIQDFIAHELAVPYLQARLRAIFAPI